jgi:hypothetical protein
MDVAVTRRPMQEVAPLGRSIKYSNQPECISILVESYLQLNRHHILHKLTFTPLAALAEACSASTSALQAKPQSRSVTTLRLRRH